MECQNCHELFTGPFCPYCGATAGEEKPKPSKKEIRRAIREERREQRKQYRSPEQKALRREQRKEYRNEQKELFGIRTFQLILGWIALSLGVICFLLGIFGTRLGLPEISSIFMPMICFFVASSFYLCPQIRWAVHKRQLSWYIYNTDDLEPSDGYVWGNHLSYYIFMVFGIFVTIISFKFSQTP